MFWFKIPGFVIANSLADVPTSRRHPILSLQTWLEKVLICNYKHLILSQQLYSWKCPNISSKLSWFCHHKQLDYPSILEISSEPFKRCFEQLLGF